MGTTSRLSILQPSSLQLSILHSRLSRSPSSLSRWLSQHHTHDHHYFKPAIFFIPRLLCHWTNLPLSWSSSLLHSRICRCHTFNLPTKFPIPDTRISRTCSS